MYLFLYEVYPFSSMYFAKASTVMILISCLVAKSWHSFNLIISPSSSLTNSPITPTSFNPANLHRSTAASVWPLLAKTPLSFALRGTIWPGLMNSSGCVTLTSSASFHGQGSVRSRNTSGGTFLEVNWYGIWCGLGVTGALVFKVC